MTTKPEDLDAMLDAALQSYTAQTPPLGLERHVLRRAHPAVLPWRIWLPVAALVTTAGFVLMMKLPRTAIVTAPPPVQFATAAATAVILTDPVTAVAPPTRPKHRAASKPAALSEGERSLLRLLVTDPGTAREMLRDSLLAMDRPMTIEAITIQPLEIQLKELN